MRIKNSEKFSSGKTNNFFEMPPKKIPKRSFREESDWSKELLAHQESETFEFEGGFLPPEEESVEKQTIRDAGPSGALAGPSGTIAGPSTGNQPKCLECKRDFVFSYLSNNFDYMACDACKDLDDKHRLITRTDAKSIYCIYSNFHHSTIF